MSNASRRQGKGQVAEMARGDMLERTGHHVLNADISQALQALAFASLCNLPNVPDVDAALVQVAAKGRAVYWAADIGVGNVSQKAGDDLLAQVPAGIADLVFIGLEVLSLGLRLRHLAAANVWIEGKAEV